MQIVADSDSIAATGAQELRSWAEALERNACLSHATSGSFVEAFTDHVPLTLQERRKYRSGLPFVKLNAWSSLRIVSFLRETDKVAGAGQIESVRRGANGSLNVDLVASSDVAGYEVAWYDVLPRGKGGGLRIVPRDRAERHVGDKVEVSAGPARNILELDPAQRWFGLFMMTRVSANNFDFVVFSADTEQSLEMSAAQFNLDASGYMQRADQGSYRVLPYGSGVRVYVRVSIEGKSVDIEPGATVGSALTGAALTGAALTSPYDAASLRLTKYFDGRPYPVLWDRRTSNILNFPLEGGESITW